MPSKNIRYYFSKERNALRRKLLATCDRCAICEGYIDPSIKTPHPLSPELDEIIPLSYFATDEDRARAAIDPNNVQLVHRKCNRWKSNKFIGNKRPAQELKLENIKTIKKW